MLEKSSYATMRLLGWQNFMQLFFRKTGIVSLLFILIATIFVGCESKKTIANGLEEKDANEILVVLASKNIDAVKTPAKVAAGGGASKVTLYDISVNASQATEAMAILNTYGLPRRSAQHLLDIFSAGGLVPSEMQQKVRYQAGLAEQIASTIRKIDGVLDADVQLSFPEEDPLNPQIQKGKITASVYVKHNGVLDDPNSHLVQKIRRLVASSVAGLDYDYVTVIGDRARFTELPGFERSTEGQEYVRVWGVVLAKDSAKRFQVLFFALCIAILLFALLAFWITWKIIPIARKRGGIRSLFHLSPLKDEYQEAKTEEKQEGDDKSKKDKGEGGGPTPPTGPAAPAGPKVQENVETP